MNRSNGDDASLVVRAREGDAGSFAMLVDRHYEACARYAYRMLGQQQDAEDALQETFMRVHRALGRYQERETFRAWLYRILINECRSLARGRGRRERRIVLDGDAAARAETPSEERTSEIRDLLQHVLASVDPLQREALLLKYGEGLEYEEIAALTGASVPALKMRVKRARDAMRPGLEEAFDER